MPKLSVGALTVAQTTPTNLNVALTRSGDSYAVDVTGALRGFKWYIFGTDSGNDLNNIFYNSVKVYRY